MCSILTHRVIFTLFPRYTLSTFSNPRPQAFFPMMRSGFPRLTTELIRLTR
jgi:hypothetical protein